MVVDEAAADEEETESDCAKDCKKIVQMPRRLDHRPNIYEVNMGVEEVRKGNEVRQIGAMLDHWHKLQMERQIDKEINEKNLFDKIMTFTKETERVTETIGNHGRAVSQVKAIYKKGQQSFKFQEI